MVFGIEIFGRPEPSSSDKKDAKPSPPRQPSPDKEPKEPPLFTTKDIGSDYYQVLREKRRPTFCKILWYVVTLGAFCFCGFLVYKLLNNYFQYSSYEQVKSSFKASITLPALTFCSSNKMNYNLMKENLPDEIVQTIDKLMEEVEIKTGNLTYDINVTSYNAIIEKYRDDNGDKVNYPREYGMSTSLFALGVGNYDYKFSGNYQDVSSNKDTDSPNQLGYCLELNDQQTMKQLIGGYQGGFVVDLNARTEEYLPSTSTAGFQIFIRNADETVMMKSSGYHIEPGREVFMKLKKNVVKRLKSPYGTCVDRKTNFPTNKTTAGTIRECEEERAMTIMVEECGCLPWYLIDRVDSFNKTNPTAATALLTKWKSKMNNSIHADMDEPECTFAMEQKCTSLVQYKLGLNASNTNDSSTNNFCEESCSYNTWDVEITTSIFPSTEIYHNNFFKHHDLDNNTFAYARENFIRLHIFYGDLVENAITQTAAYEIQNFIAELGGTVDSIIGVSFFTCFQAVEISIGLLLYRNRDRPQ